MLPFVNAYTNLHPRTVNETDELKALYDPLLPSKPKDLDKIRARQLMKRGHINITIFAANDNKRIKNVLD